MINDRPPIPFSRELTWEKYRPPLTRHCFPVVHHHIRSYGGIYGGPAFRYRTTLYLDWRSVINPDATAYPGYSERETFVFTSVAHARGVQHVHPFHQDD